MRSKNTLSILSVIYCIGWRLCSRMYGNLDVGKVLASRLHALNTEGYEVCEESCREQATSRMIALGKAGVTPILSGHVNSFPHGNCVSVFLQREGKDVAGGFARFDDLQSETLGDFAARLLRQSYGLSGDQGVRSRGGALSEKISGRVVYFGDLYICSSERGTVAKLSSFVTVMQILCHTYWGYDWMWANLRERDVMRGVATRYNFSDMEAVPNIWTNPPDGRSNKEYLVATTRQRFLDRMAAEALQLTGVE